MNLHGTSVFVTGGTGFVGSHLVRRLVEAGAKVRALTRQSSKLDNLKDLPIETVTGDLLEVDSLRSGMRGCQRVYHCAADYRLWLPDPREIYRNNVDGTRNVLQAARDSGVEQVVYTSSVATIKIPDDGSLGREDLPVTIDDMVGDYKRSKFLAERVAQKFAREGLPVYIVNPSMPIGSHDIKPTPTGQIVVSFLRRAYPAYVDTGLNPIHVKDVVEGHLLVTEKGRPGELYILGNQNMTFKQILDLLAQITGLPAPRIRIPYAASYAFAAVNTLIANRVTHRAPFANLESVKMTKHRMWFDSAQAIRELGLPQTPVEQAFREAVSWFCRNGYAPWPPALTREAEAQ